jgi:hypothetical protein
MIVFFSKDAEEVMLAGAIKHYNPSAILRLYENNEDLLAIAKMHNESNFLRIKDYKMSIINSYEMPSWAKDDSKLRFIELSIANRNTNIYSFINHLAEHFFNPEKLFHSALDKTVMFKDNAMQVITELGVFLRNNKHFTKNGIIYYEINPIHDISIVYSKSLLKKHQGEPFIILQEDKATAFNAKKLGFNEDKAVLERFEALKLKKIIKIQPTIRSIIKETLATKISEYN